eukprot:gene8269-2211_t
MYATLTIVAAVACYFAVRQLVHSWSQPIVETVIDRGVSSQRWPLLFLRPLCEPFEGCAVWDKAGAVGSARREVGWRAEGRWALSAYAAGPPLCFAAAADPAAGTRAVSQDTYTDAGLEPGSGVSSRRVRVTWPSDAGAGEAFPLIVYAHGAAAGGDLE